MTKEQLQEEIKALQGFMDTIQLQVVGDKDFILRCYIKTESLSKTKTILKDITMDNGNKYQVNDIRDLILAGADEADESVNDLAYRIYKANKKQSGKRR